MTRKTDLLVVGGSLAGLSAAITAKEQNPDLDVTVVEKYTAGYAGKANRGAGILDVLGESRPEDFVKYHATYIGDGLNNQQALYNFAANLNAGLEDLDRWSDGKVDKREDGSFRTLKWLAQITGEDAQGKRTFSEPEHFPWTLACVELDYMRNVRRTAQKAGVKFVDRVGIVDLLTSGGAVCGAVGFSLDSGERLVAEAKAVILATGSQNYRVMPMWSPGRGEGLAAAWRAGAKMTNCEFGSFYNWTSLENFESNMGVEFALFNNKGENVGLPHTRGEHPDVDQNSLAEWYKQVRDGNGPMHYRQDQNPLMPYLMSTLASDSYFNRPYADRFWGYLFFNAFSQQTSDECVPGLIGEFSPLWVDESFATTIPGLFAAGDICYGGSRATGAVPPPPARIRGSGLAFALHSGRTVARSAAAYAARAQALPVSEGDADAVEQRFKAPLTAGGTIPPMEFLGEIQKVMQPLGNSLYRREDRLNAALARVKELQDRLPQVAAATPHQLFEVNEFASMLLCAELFFRASLLRRESRGWFLREDYPEHSGQLKWYSFVNEKGAMVSSEETVPEYHIF